MYLQIMIRELHLVCCYSSGPLGESQSSHFVTDLKNLTQDPDNAVEVSQKQNLFDVLEPSRARGLGVRHSVSHIAIFPSFHFSSYFLHLLPKKLEV